MSIAAGRARPAPLFHQPRHPLHALPAPAQRVHDAGEVGEEVGGEEAGVAKLGAEALAGGAVEVDAGDGGVVWPQALGQQPADDAG